MFLATNLKFFLMAIIPALAYGMIIYISSNYKSISLKKGVAYFALGAISVTFVNAFQFTFPYFQEFSILPSMPIISLLLKAVIQIALIEEMSKWISYKFIDSVRHRVELKRDKPVATMFYACMVSAGFAVIENIHYVIAYYNEISPGELLTTRSFSAVITHMICGLFMGYFIALANQKPTIDFSLISIILRKHPLWRKFLYTTIGIACAVLFHGFYDFIISIGAESSIYELIALGLLIAYSMHKKLNGLSKHRDKIS